MNLGGGELVAAGKGKGKGNGTEKGKWGRMSAAAAAAAAAAVLPVGFRFRPTDEELVRHYLKAKIAGRPHPDLLVIPDVDLATCEPWDLPAKSVIKSDDPEWFFFGPRDRPKYPGRHRSNRSTAAGYWKATGKDRLIRSAGTLIGIKKTLVFHRGRAPRGHRTAWIMHEYSTTEPHFQSGQNGSFVLYRLFNKQDQDLNSESPSTSSGANPLNDHNASMTLPSSSGLSQLTVSKIAADDAHHPAKQQTSAQEDTFLDVLAQLPDLQAEQRYDGFPNISSPMRPYTDHPFMGNMDEQDFSAYFDTIIAKQEQDLLLNPAYAKTDTGNADCNTTALVTSTNNSINNALLEDSWSKGDSDQVLLVQHADATRCSSAINALQSETGEDNHETRGQTNIVYSGADQGSHLYSQYQLELPPVFDPQTESQNGGVFCSSSSSTPYPRHLFNAMVEPNRSDMINSNALTGQEGWAAEPSTQQSTVPESIDLQQGTAVRRIRLVCAVQRASSASQHLLTSHLESEDEEAESCCSTGSSSNNHDEDYVNAASQTKAGDLMHIQVRGHIPTQVASSVEVTDKLQHLSLNEDILAHIKLPGGANLTQRLRHDCAHTTGNADECLVQKSDRGDPSSETRRSTGCVVRLLLVVAPLVVLVGVWRFTGWCKWCC